MLQKLFLVLGWYSWRSAMLQKLFLVLGWYSWRSAMLQNGSLHFGMVGLAIRETCAQLQVDDDKTAKPALPSEAHGRKRLPLQGSAVLRQSTEGHSSFDA
jgi:hypothetical protein